MNYKLKNIFWLKGLDINGNEAFFPITFSKQLDRVILIKRDVSYIFLHSEPQNEITKKIVNCLDEGCVDFVAPYGIKLFANTKLYYGPKLFEAAIKHSNFIFQPKEVKEFVCKEDGFFYKECFDEFCDKHELSRKKILSFNNAFKKAAIYVEYDSSIKRLDKVSTALESLKKSNDESLNK